MTDRNKPAPITVGPLKAYAKRGPSQSDPRWYWQVVHHRSDRQESVKGAARRGTPDEITVHLAQLVADGNWEEVPVERNIHTLDDLVLSWLAHQRQRRDRPRPAITMNSYKRYRRSLARLCQDHDGVKGLGGLLLREVTAEALQQWIDDKAASGASPRTMENTRQRLMMAWKWGLKEGVITEKVPEAEWPEVKPDEYVYPHHTPDEAEAERIVDALKGWQRVCGELLLATGARIQEIAKLRWKDWDQRRGLLLLRQKRSRKKAAIRPVGVTAELRVVLLRWQADQGGRAHPDGWLLGVKPATHSFFQKVLPPLCEQLGIPITTAHGFRRLVATQLIRAGVNPKAYEAHMGHSYRLGLEIYAQVTGQEMQAVAAILGRRSRHDVLPFSRQSGG